MLALSIRAEPKKHGGRKGDSNRAAVPAKESQPPVLCLASDLRQHRHRRVVTMQLGGAHDMRNNK